MSELIDNRATRVRALKEIITRLNEGGSPEDAKRRLQGLLGEVDHSELVSMEQELLAEGMPVQKLQSVCDLHSQVVRDSLVQLAPPPLPPGHPVDTFRRENQALREVAAAMRGVMAQMAALAAEAAADGLLLGWRQALNDLMDLEKHYQRKEHALFSCLERHGISGPSKVMWAKDDEVRGLLKALGDALRGEGAAAHWQQVAASVAEPALRAVEEMIFKEEQILLPMALQTLTEDEWGEIWSVSPQYGWCLVEPREGYRPPQAVTPPGSVEVPGGRPIMLPTGNLTLEQLLGVFSTLPVDLTFVDAGDRVAFFSEGPDRVFSRSKAIIGRKVQHCHPPRSVAVVDQILDDFRGGRQDVAEFWINFHGRFVHIRYFAVRDAERNYVGTLEVTQDITGIRALEGERRLLQY
ncbi:MAG: DUF438 domain-containing protein [Acidobacteria bacterium]|nr:DUF438 domain-containing protein [Acidobacteriota bacterium]